ncbi:glycosyltransferase family 4 protein [Paenibacillus whitsoniae]|uniref:glycosyltransferase family 4 protein n=1 Tax=Paenibacillus whitsoniae TaxID=2496558 RepID=UPI0013DF110A|nr:glycosyltransferase family 4 protein [Paenibacillus whitsoniae]
MKKVLIISPDRIALSMAGPGIRYWNFAIELSRSCDVTLLVKNSDAPVHTDFKIVLKGTEDKNTFYSSFECIVIQGLTLWEMPFLKNLNIPIVVDLYDPFIFENLEIKSDEQLSIEIAKSNLEILKEQIYVGDYFICASNKQKDFWLGLLAATFRINPETYREDHSLNNLLGVVPFGMPEYLPVKKANVIKGIIEGIHVTDKVVLWWGGIWDWLDPITLINAMSIICEIRPDIKCLIIGTEHPDKSFVPHKMVDKVLSRSGELGLTNRVVFFKGWVPYEDRMDYLLEADVGVSLHYNNLETRFAFRTRILDYLWCELPMVVTSGDVLSEIVKENHIGCVIDAEDDRALADALIDMVDHGKCDFSKVRHSYHWNKVTEDLRLFCENPRKAVDHSVIRKYVSKPTSRTKLYLLKGIKLLREGNVSGLYRKLKSKFLS